MKLPRQSESAVLAQCLAFLRLHGVYCWRQNQGAIPLKDGGYRKFVGMRGQSDIVGLLPGSGRMLCVETKRPGGKLSVHQKLFLDSIRANGGLALCVSDVLDLREALRLEGVIK